MLSLCALEPYLTLNHLFKPLQSPKRIFPQKVGVDKHAWGMDGQGGKIGPDLNMPRMNGLDFIEAARREPEGRSLPMLLLTTETAQTLKDRARAVKATGWLNKPFDPGQILSLVDQLS